LEAAEDFRDRHDYWAYQPSHVTWAESREEARAARAAVAGRGARRARHDAASPTVVDIDDWLRRFEASDPDAVEALSFWGELFPHRGARMAATDEERRHEKERERLIGFLLAAYEVPATSSAASRALESIGYVAHLPIGDELW
jgi:hypothetical protein